jgi:GntR family transcriptional regulator
VTLTCGCEDLDSTLVLWRNDSLSGQHNSPTRTLTQRLPRLDRSSPVPLYFQVERMLEQEIVAGRWVQGLRLPAEPDLCEQLEVSRSVVRQALARLEQQGLIVRRKGQGTYVASSQPRSWLLQGASGFFEDETGRMGRQVTSTVLRAEVEPLPRWAADALGYAEGTRGVTIERLRSVDDLVALYVVNHLPEEYAAVVTDLVRDPDDSLYGKLKERFGLDVAGGRRVVEAVVAGPSMARTLGVAETTPLVFIESVSWGADYRRFDCYRTWLRSDRMKIDVEVASMSARPTIARQPASSSEEERRLEVTPMT